MSAKEAACGQGGQGRGLGSAGHVETLREGREGGYAVPHHHCFAVQEHVREFACQA